MSADCMMLVYLKEKTRISVKRVFCLWDTVVLY